MLGEVCVISKSLMAVFAEVNAWLLVDKRHVLPEVRGCFAHVIALPATERLRVHMNSAKYNFFSRVI